MAARWSSAAASLDRCWIGKGSRRRRPPTPCRASVPAAPPPRWTGRIGGGGAGCVSARAAAEAEAEQTALPEIDAEPEEEGVACEECGGAGWRLCGFCKGKKNNVKSEESSRIYRRCPTCKAAGHIMCSRCRVYRCITYPESDDS